MHHIQYIYILYVVHYVLYSLSCMLITHKRHKTFRGESWQTFFNQCMHEHVHKTNTLPLCLRLAALEDYVLVKLSSQCREIMNHLITIYLSQSITFKKWIFFPAPMLQY